MEIMSALFDQKPECECGGNARQDNWRKNIADDFSRRYEHRKNMMRHGHIDRDVEIDKNRPRRKNILDALEKNDEREQRQKQEIVIMLRKQMAAAVDEVISETDQ